MVNGLNEDYLQYLQSYSKDYGCNNFMKTSAKLLNNDTTQKQHLADISVYYEAMVNMKQNYSTIKKQLASTIPTLSKQWKIINEVVGRSKQIKSSYF